MNAFTTLTRRGQVARLRRVAQSILPEYSLVNPRLSFISHGFNTTFCVRSQDGQEVGPSEIYARVRLNSP